MADGVRSCEACGNYLDPEDLFCANCGREGPRGEDVKADQIEEGLVGFDCESCGASLTYDAASEGLRCSFCGSVSLKRQPEPTGRIRPLYYLPFETTREEAQRKFRKWVGRGFFRPLGIREEAAVVSMQPVYIPFWVVLAKTHTRYAADSSRTPAGARADWCPVYGERSGQVDDVLVSASGSLHPGEVGAISPFDFSRKRPYRRAELRSYAVEDFGLSRRGARPLGRALIEERERAACAGLVPGRARNVHVNVLAHDMRSEPALLPVWINAYRYREGVYRFCVNGQTGALTGTAPVSYARLAIVLAVILLAVLALGLAVGLFAR